MQDELDHHGQGHGHRHNDLGLDEEQANLMISAIEMHEIKAEDIMTSPEKIFSLSFDTVIDNNTIRTIISKGFSRIPIYNVSKDNFVGILKINSLLKINPELKQTIRNLGIELYQPVVLPPDATVYECLQTLRKGKSQMAFITNNVDALKKNLVSNSRDTLIEISNMHKDKSNLETSNVKVFPKEAPPSIENTMKAVSFDHTNSYFPENFSTDVIGLITLEDVIERMIKIDIFDEEDYITKKARASVAYGRSGSRYSIKEQKISNFNI